MKRFYKNVGIGEHENQWCVLLDDKPIKTPHGTVIVAPTQPLAEAMKAEWDSQDETIDMRNMPMTRLNGGAVSIDEEERQRMVDDICGYAETDLLCYWAEEQELQARQQAEWEPVLQWVQSRYGVTFERCVGIMPVQQPQASLDEIAKQISALDNYQLVAAAQMVPALGSVLLVLAVLEGHISVDEAISISQLDERYQVEKWGEDEEATQRRQEKAAAINLLGNYVIMLGQAA